MTVWSGGSSEVLCLNWGLMNSRCGWQWKQYVQPPIRCLLMANQEGTLLHLGVSIRVTHCPSTYFCYVPKAYPP